MKKVIIMLLLSGVVFGFSDCVRAKKGCKKNYKKIKKMRKSNEHFTM